MLAGMNRRERRYRWAALLVATCMGLPLQTWADAEISEKIRFERQAQAVTIDHTTEADVEQTLHPEQSTPSSNPAETEQAAEPEDLFTDDGFEDERLIELQEGLLSVVVQDAAY